MKKAVKRVLKQNARPEKINILRAFGMALVFLFLFCAFSIMAEDMTVKITGHAGESPSESSGGGSMGLCGVEGDFCGGMQGMACCSGYTCQLDGSYPDAGGTCVEGLLPSQCTDSDGG